MVTGETLVDAPERQGLDGWANSEQWTAWVADIAI